MFWAVAFVVLGFKVLVCFYRFNGAFGPFCYPFILFWSFFSFVTMSSPTSRDVKGVFSFKFGLCLIVLYDVFKIVYILKYCLKFLLLLLTSTC